MSDEITAATLQMAEKAASVAGTAAEKSIEIIAMLLRELSQTAERHRQRQSEKQKASKSRMLLLQI